MPPRMACAKGSEGNARSASHSRAMVDMLARCVKYHADFGDASALRTARKRAKSSSDAPSFCFPRGASFFAAAVPPRRFGSVAPPSPFAAVADPFKDGSGKKNRTRIMFLLSRPST